MSNRSDASQKFDERGDDLAMDITGINVVRVLHIPSYQTSKVV